MVQVIQYQKTGKLSIENLPTPRLRPGGVLVQNVFSLISPGTERTSVETAQASIIGKARSRPDLVKQVLQNAKREGIWSTYKKVQNRMDKYKDLGYSSAGIVIESSVAEFKRGDRVACGGAGYASHAELVFVPKNLAAKLPKNVGFDEAAFATVSSIALQAVRQAEVKLGESIAVIGLGLLGLITIQLLRANGCRVIGLDIHSGNFDLARKLGCSDCCISNLEAVQRVESFTKGLGADATIITASTNSNEPVELALQFARKKSRVVVVGAVGMNVPRSPFYEKELDLRISCSYGPGRYDSQYEERGTDYPIGYVRWTENRNIQAILELMSQGKLNVKALATHRYPVQRALEAYHLLTGKTKERYLGILIDYGEGIAPSSLRSSRIDISPPTIRIGQSQVGVGFIGIGNFAQAYLLPPLHKLDVRLRGAMTADPIQAKMIAKNHRFEFCTTNIADILSDNSINAVLIATRHDSHAQYVVKALEAGKSVFVEKPLALNERELLSIKKVFEKGVLRKGQTLNVGFNRRFSKPFRDIKSFFAGSTEPMVVTYRVNAGFIPKEHWTQQPEQGGRLIGEGCHFVDAMSFLTGARPTRVFAEAIESSNERVKNDDNISIVISFSDGSIGNLLYLANGDTSLPKELCEAFSGSRAARMDNFRRVTLHAEGKERVTKYNGSKGHNEELAHFLECVKKGSPSEFTFESLFYTTLTTFKVLESLQKRSVVEVE